MEKPISVFYLYADSERDHVLFQELEKHLKILEHRGTIAGWHKGALLPGEEQAEGVAAHLRGAQLVLLLISPDFMASSSYLKEMMQALERQGMGRTEIVPLLLRPTYYVGAPFAHLRMLPHDGSAVTSPGKNMDEAFAQIAHDLDALLQQRWNGGTSVRQEQQEQQEHPVNEERIVQILDALNRGIDLYHSDARVKSDYLALYNLLDQKFASDARAREVLEEFVQEPQEWRGALKKALKIHRLDLKAEVSSAAKQVLASGPTPATPKVIFNNSGKIGTQFIGDHNTSHTTNNF